jgi:hypothetical protein
MPVKTHHELLGYVDLAPGRLSKAGLSVAELLQSAFSNISLTRVQLCQAGRGAKCLGIYPRGPGGESVFFELKTSGKPPSPLACTGIAYDCFIAVGLKCDREFPVFRAARAEALNRFSLATVAG